MGRKKKSIISFFSGLFGTGAEYFNSVSGSIVKYVSHTGYGIKDFFGGLVHRFLPPELWGTAKEIGVGNFATYFTGPLAKVISFLTGTEGVGLLLPKDLELPYYLFVFGSVMSGTYLAMDMVDSIINNKKESKDLEETAASTPVIPKGVPATANLEGQI